MHKQCTNNAQTMHKLNPKIIKFDTKFQLLPKKGKSPPSWGLPIKGLFFGEQYRKIE
jgi:hypothetical protein